MHLHLISPYTLQSINYSVCTKRLLSFIWLLLYPPKIVYSFQYYFVATIFRAKTPPWYSQKSY